MSSTFPQEGFAPSNGLRLHYKDWGGNGRPVLLLHGLASNCCVWDLVAPHLVAGGCRVVALDQRGHGQSDKPDDGYDFDSVTGDARQFWKTFGFESPVVIGHSWGGNVVLHCAASYPSEVSGIVMVDGGFLEPSARPGWTRQVAEKELAPPFFDNVTVQEFKERIRNGTLAQWYSPEIERIVLANFYVTPEGFIRPNLTRDNHLRIIRALWDHKPTQLYPGVRCPVLALACRGGPPWRNNAYEDTKAFLVEKARQLLPNGDVRWLDDTIHDVPLQRPHDLAEMILGFVSKT
jgi:pimeloyl-ACP methyl ester carboxylesterase